MMKYCGMKGICLMLLFFSIVFFGHSQTMGVAGVAISPVPLGTLETDNTGTISFFLGELSGAEVPATGTGGVPNIVVEVDLKRLELAGGVPGIPTSITGSVLDKFIASYDVGNDIVIFTQKPGVVIEADWFGFVTINVLVTENSTSDNFLNGFVIDVTASHPDSAGETGQSIFTYTTPSCVLPILIVGDTTCNGTDGTYTVSFATDTDVTNISATSSGSNTPVINTTDKTVTLALGEDLTITATNGTGCITSTKITGPATCPTNCVFSDLTLGNAICAGTEYKVGYSETTGAVLSYAIVGTGTIDDTTTAGVLIVPNTVTSFTVTATNGDCAISLEVSAPQNCDEPCFDTPISLGTGVCSAGGLDKYEIRYTKIDDATVTVENLDGSPVVGSSTAIDGIITGLPSGVNVVVRVAVAGCADDRTIEITAATCPECILPILTVGDTSCDATNYSVTIGTDVALGNISVSSTGTNSASIVGNIATALLGEDITVRVSNGLGCETVRVVVGPNDCPTNCIQSDLTVGDAICSGSNYEVGYSETTGATLSYVIVGTGIIDDTTTAGVLIVPNTVTSFTVTATNGDCEVGFTITAPTDCDDPCKNSPISLGAAVCDASGAATYEIGFTAIAAATVTVENLDGSPVVGSSVGANTITGLPSGVNVVVRVAVAGCADDRTIEVTAATCPECILPILTVGDTSCDATNYSVTIGTDVALGNISVSSTGTNSASIVGNIATALLGEDITVRVSNGLGCETVRVVVGPNDCPTNCIQSDLTVGDAICSGSNYEVGYSETTGATLSYVIVGTGIIDDTTTAGVLIVPNTVTSFTVTATNGDCEVGFTITAPTDCDDPCKNSPISLGAAVCDASGAATYEIGFTAIAAATVTVENLDGSPVVGSSVGANTITGLPSGVNVVVRVAVAGCADDRTIEVTAATCPECILPILTVGDTSCDATNYSVTIGTDVALGNISVSSTGTNSASIVGNIATALLGEDITVRVSNGLGCETVRVVVGPNDCPTNCIQSDLTVGDAICSGSNYEVGYSETTGATLSYVIVGTGIIDDTTTAGVLIVPNTVTSFTVTATNGDCEVGFTITAPTDCDDPCKNSPISLGAAVCDASGAATYEIGFTAIAAATVTVENLDGSPVVGSSVGANTITGLPSGVNVVVRVAVAGCADDRTIEVTAATCPECILPILTVGDTSCDATNYSVTIGTDVALGNISVSSTGTNSASIVGNIATALLGEDITVRVSNGLGCETVRVVVGPNDCPTNCIQSDLTVGDAICSGSNYEVGYSETTGATLSYVIVGTGIIDDTTTAGVLIVPNTVTSFTVTATNGDCEVGFTITAPTDCDDPCKNSPISLGAAVCDASGAATYEIGFTAIAAATVTVENLDGSPVVGSSVGANTITGLPSGVNVVVRVAVAGCADDRTIEVTAATCPECILPILTVGDTSCDATNYSVTIGTDVALGNISVSSTGTNSASIVGNIATALLGEDITVRVSNGLGCETVRVVVGPNDCPTNCIQSDLTVGDAICSGSNYEVGYSETTGATLSYVIVGTGIIDDTTTAGVLIVPNTVTSFTVTATNGDCEVGFTITAPTDCDDPCKNSPISLGAAVCDASGAATYEIGFTAIAAATVTVENLDGSPVVGSSVGANTITGLPSGVNVVVRVAVAGCADDRTIEVTAATCPECILPILTVGDTSCDATNYSVTIGTDVALGNISVSSTGTNSASIVGNIATALLGEDITVRVSNGLGCETVRVVVGPNDCPTNCIQSDLTVGDAICSGSNYEVGYSETTGATLSYVIVGTGIIDDTTTAGVLIVPNTVTSFTVTATNGDCEVGFTITAPTDCDDPCKNSPISLGAAVCDASGAATYEIGFTAIAAATVTVENLDGSPVVGSSVGANTITGLPSGVNVVVRVAVAGCADDRTIEVTAATCPECILPILTVGDTSCDATNYSVTIGTDVALGNISVSSTGTNSASIVGNIATALLGEDITVRVSNGLGCETVRVVVGPNDCPTNCIQSDLTVGDAICSGSNYEVGYSETTGATLSYVIVGTGIIDDTTTAGVLIVPNTVTSFTVTATNGDCEVGFTITAPTDCDDPCKNSPISLGAAVCDASGAATYEIGFTAIAAATVTVENLDGSPVVGSSVGANTITGLPSGVNVVVRVAVAGCADDRTIEVTAATCPECILPILTVGDTSCDATNYSVTIGTDVALGNISVSSTGTNSASIVGNIATALLGEDITVRVSNGLGCETVRVVVGPNDCPTNCIQSDLTVGDAICSGSNYEVGYSETTGATLSYVIVGTGIIDDTTTAGVLIVPNTVTSFTVTATNGDCEVGFTITAPTDCDDPCKNSPISLGAAVCDASGAATYEIGFTAIAAATVTVENLDGSPVVGSSVGANTITGLPSGVNVVVRVAVAGCADDRTIEVTAATCPECILPILTVGDTSCDATNYSVTIGTDVALGNISVSSTGTNSASIVGNIATALLGEDITVRVSNGLGCETVRVVVGPNDCPTNCIQSDLTVGDAICSGSTYEVGYSETTGATLSYVIVGTGIIDDTTTAGVLIVPNTVTSFTVTATNGDCEVGFTITAPTDCDDPCKNSPISLGAAVCDASGAATYEIGFTAIAAATVTVENLDGSPVVGSSVGANTITGLPSGVNVVVRVAVAGCADDRTIEVTAATCPECILPILTVGDTSCDATNYSVTIGTDVALGNISVSSTGTNSASIVGNIATALLGEDITVRVSNGLGCETVRVVVGPNDCPTNCIQSDLTVGDAICSGSNYEVGYSETTGATLSYVIVGTGIIDDTTTAGVLIVPNTVTSFTVTATNGDCEVGFTITAPTDCDDPCKNSPISLGAAVCDASGAATYEIGFTAIAAATVTVENLDGSPVVGSSVGANTITGLPSGVNVVVRVAVAGCADDRTIEVTAATCPECILPILTVGDTSCDATNYSVTIGTDVALGNISVSSTGTNSASIVGNIATALLGEDITVRVSNGLGCETVRVVVGPNDCPTNCIQSDLTVGDAICSGSNYEVGYSETTGATLSYVIVGTGIIDDTTTAGVLIVPNTVTSFTVTATNGDCEVGFTITAPTDCDDPCKNSPISLGAAVCDASGAATYEIGFTAIAAATVTVENLDGSPVVGSSVGANTITGLPSGVNVVVRVAVAGCADDRTIEVTAATCPECILPILTVGDTSCDATNYSVTIGTDVALGNISVSSTGTNSASIVGNIATALLGEDITVRVSNGLGCETVRVVVGPNDCPTNCIQSDLTVGDAICSGSNYEVGYSETTGATLSYVIVGTGIIDDTTTAGVLIVPNTVTSFTVTATNGDCEVGFTITAPTDCDDPCKNSPISLGAAVCDASGAATYEIGFTAIAAATVTVENLDGSPVVGSSVGANTITGLPSGVNVVVRVAVAGCADDRTIEVTAATCPECILPILTVGDTSCDATNYSVTIGTDVALGNISVSSTGTNSASIVGNIATALLGEDITVRVSNGLGCETVRVVVGPNDCPTNCIQSDLTVGDAICSGSNYEVGYSETTGATLSYVIVGTGIIDDTTTAGVLIVPNTVTSFTVTATNGDCEVGFTITAPTDCDDPCKNSPISLGAAVCDASGAATYEIGFTAIAAATVTVENLDGSPVVGSSVGANTITGLPSGVNVVVRVAVAGCADDRTIEVTAATCPECILPILTVGDTSCDATNYSVTIGTDVALGNISVSSTGTNSASIVGNIATALLGEDITVRVSNGLGCETVRVVVGPNDCPTNCIQSDLTVGDAICSGSNYEVGYSETTGATLSYVIVGTGIIDDTTTAGVLIVPNTVTSFTVTATNGDCEVGFTITAPTDCDDPCKNSPISLGAAVCDASGAATYEIGFTAIAAATVTVENLDGSPVVGSSVGANTITGLPSGVNVVVRVAVAGCADDRTIEVTAATCPECILPILTVGDTSCDATNYSVTIGTDVALGNISVSSTGTNSASIVGNIATALLGEDITVRVSNGLGCETVRVVVGPNDCPTNCIQSDLTVGDAICSGSNYEVGYSETTGATLSYVIVGTGIIDDTTTAGVLIVPNTVTSFTVTATNGDCEVGFTITAPTDCDDPCKNSPISLGAAVCDASGAATYEIGFTAIAAATVTVENLDGSPVVGSSVGANTITGLPSGVNVVVRVAVAGCADDRTIEVTAATCPECILPALSAETVGCSGSTYSVRYNTDAAGITATSSGASTPAINTTTKTITLALGEDLTISASSGTGCDTTIVVLGPDTCPVNCVTPVLSAAQGICEAVGGSTYSVSFSETTTAVITIWNAATGTDLSGIATLNANSITGIPIGTNIEIRATSQIETVGCTSISVVVNSPDNCDDPCGSALIAVGGTSCAADGTYDIHYVAQPGVTIVVEDASGTPPVGADISVPGIVTGIPNNVAVKITASLIGCTDTEIDIAARSCIPDYAVTMIAGITTVDGPSETINFRIDIGEFNNANSNGTVVEVRVPKLDPRLVINYDNSISTLDGNDVDNSDWTYVGTNPFNHIFRYVGSGGIFPKATSSIIGVGAVFNPVFETSGEYKMRAIIKTSSGGEINNANNNGEIIIIYNNN